MKTGAWTDGIKADAWTYRMKADAGTTKAHYIQTIPMTKKNIALVAGGDSGEYVISVESARMIKGNLDPERFQVFTILVSREKWVYLPEEGAEVAVDKNDFSVTIGGKKIRFDCAFITIHGTPGEDGKLQGYFDLLGIPYNTAGLLPSALTFNKSFCNIVARHFGMEVAHSVRFGRQEEITEADVLSRIRPPVFVKPNKGGSSLGTSFVTSREGLMPAIRLALEHDDEAFVEAYIEGTELTCGVFRKQGKVIPLPVTEIISKTEARFFDFQAKYTKGAADEITPARISESLTQQVQAATAMLYEKFGMKGMARMDFIYSQGKLFFLEINVTPGMAETSIVPQQAAFQGISIRDLFTAVIEDAITAGGQTTA
jgi:D-alanine-D-alanine ligase